MREVDDFVFRLVLWIDIFFVNLQVVLMKSIVNDRKAMVDRDIWYTIICILT